MTDFKAEIGIICALDVELAGIKNMMADISVEKISGVTFICGTLEGKKAVAAECGVGKVFAAICAEAMILKYRPEIIINSGVAGGLSKTLSISDAAIATDAVEHDMDSSALGDPVGMISGINIIKLPCDEYAVKLLLGAAKDLGIHAEAGTIASGDKFIASDSDRERIRQNFGAIACEMEGASIAHVCYVNSVRCAILRTVSDGGDDSAAKDFPAFCEKAAVQSQKIIKRFVRDFND